MNNKICRNFFIFFLVSITLTFFYMHRPFIYLIFWAAILAGIFHPLYKLILRKFKNPNMSAALTLLIVFFVLFLPFFLLMTILVSESFELYTAVNNNGSQIKSSVQNMIDWIKNNPYTSVFAFDEKFLMDKFSEVSQKIGKILFNATKTFTQNFLNLLVKTVLMFYTLFFFLRDGEKIMKYLMQLCPPDICYEKIIYEKFTSTIRATLKSLLIISSIQGTLGGIVFWFTGLEGTFIWGVFMALVSIFPPFGSALVWFPVGIFMLLTGKIWQGLTILAFGILIISTLDNFLRPILIGKDTALHPVIVLFSTLGGLWLFDTSGLVFGPIVAALFMTSWKIYDPISQRIRNVS